MKTKQLICLLLAMMMIQGVSAQEKSKLVINYQYKKCRDFHDGLAVVVSGEGVGYIDKRGNVVVPFKKYKMVDPFSEGLAAVSQGDKWGYIDKQGHLVIALQYGGLPEEWKNNPMLTRNEANMMKAVSMFAAKDFHEGLAAVSRNGKWGFVDKNGKVVVDFQFDDAGDFHEGLARVRNKDNRHYTD
jgi:hypothetical protein